jgi:4-hydroxybenzoate polyprenyltransferase
VFIPMVFAHALASHAAWIHAVGAFIAFNCTASAGYVFNDIQDRERDRLHPTKRNRPLASGTVSVTGAWLIALVLLVIALLLAYQGGLNLCLGLLGYLLLTTVYSKLFKWYVLIDVLVLAALYTARIIVGAIAVHVLPSMWLLSLSMFVFFSLALVKRITELMLTSSKPNETGMLGRDYNASDIDSLRAMGISSGTTSVLVLALYIDSAQAAHQYANPLWLWPACPILWYWISRMWIKTGRGEMHDDPIVYSLSDRASWLCFAVIGLCWINASLGLTPNPH